VSSGMSDAGVPAKDSATEEKSSSIL
jgi:hypothetical protein